MPGSAVRSLATFAVASALSFSGVLAGPPTGAAAGGPEPGRRAPVGEPVQVVGRCADRLGTSQLVTDLDGTSTATWGCAHHVYAARTAADGTWQTAVDLGVGLEPKAAVDDRNRVTVLYRHLQGNGIESRRWAGAAWQPPVDLTWQTDAKRVFVQWYSIASNARGDVVAVWTQNDGEVQSGPAPWMVAAYRPFDGAWTTTVRVAKRAFAQGSLVDGAGRVVTLPGLYRRTTGGVWRHPALPAMQGAWGGAAVNPAGDLLVTRTPTGGSTEALVYEKPYGAAWLPAVQVGTTRSSGQVRAVLDDTGEAVVSFAAGGSARTATRPAGGDWAAPVQVSESHVQASVVRLDRGPDGSTAVSWLQGPEFVKRQLWVSVQPPGGDWSVPVRVTGARWRHVDHTTLSLRPDGALVVAWTGQRAGRTGWWFATRAIS
ncbi:MAG: hypothetical protein KDB63_11495 [Nocardioidaceae bacterium]|nr:hypothetical protein [Nocardioidaceae bacterium]